MNAPQLLREVEANLKELASETDRLKQSDFFKAYLETMSKFWQYSYHNQLLIHFAMPNAAKVAGFKKWQELGRFVRKGSKSIKILAPFVHKVDEIDPETSKAVEKEVTLFFPVSVFDVSQTEGKSLPELDVVVEGDEAEWLHSRLVAFCEEKSIKLNFKALGINGLYGYSLGGEIAVSDKESVNMQVNTLVHEISHELLHKDSKLSKQQKEIQAEGAAYVVTKHFGLENKSVNYLALCDADYTKIVDNLKAIAQASREVIAFVEGFSFSFKLRD